MKKANRKTLDLAQVALLGAIILVLAFTPFLGYIPLGFTRATTIHIPVIIASIVLGPKKGALLGGLFGLTSLINNTINPTVTSFVFTPFYSVGGTHGNFWSVVICFLPRILVGIVPYYVYKGIKKLQKNGTKGDALALGAAGICGSMTNTLLVMNLIFFFFSDSYAAANAGKVASYGGLYTFILSLIGINGVPEAIVAAILTVAVCKILLKSKILRNGVA